MSSLSFAENKERSKIVENETTSIVIDDLTIVGVCNFSYTLTFSNEVTEENYQQTYFHSTYATSQSDCESITYWHARSHAQKLQKEMN
jgi:hypothetical protein